MDKDMKDLKKDARISTEKKSYEDGMVQATINAHINDHFA